MSDITERAKIFVPFTNTDLTEGRGYAVPLHVCTVEATAARIGAKKSVQGSDCEIRQFEMIRIDGKWYVPRNAVRIIEPDESDIASQKVVDARRAAVEKAKSAGLTAEDLKALGVL